MDPALRHAWTEVISADDYETHMAAIGQAQAAASLTEWLLTEAPLAADSRITIAGAGTGQMIPAAGNAHWMSRIERNSGRYYLFGNSL